HLSYLQLLAHRTTPSSNSVSLHLNTRLEGFGIRLHYITRLPARIALSGCWPTRISPVVSRPALPVRQTYQCQRLWSRSHASIMRWRISFRDSPGPRRCSLSCRRLIRFGLLLRKPVCGRWTALISQLNLVFACLLIVRELAGPINELLLSFV